MRYNSFERAEASRYRSRDQEEATLWQQPSLPPWLVSVMAISALLAALESDARTPVRAGIDWEFAGLILALVVLIGFGIRVTLKLRARATSELTSTREYSLTEYQEMLEKGLLDRQEFERIRESLMRKPPTPPANS